MSMGIYGDGAWAGVMENADEPEGRDSKGRHEAARHEAARHDAWIAWLSRSHVSGLTSQLVPSSLVYSKYNERLERYGVQ
ncbi:hypothetical protein MMC29_007967, partial [Sticta canariensis]|nr:hypothetical protein [Sticta canariensis]